LDLLTLIFVQRKNGIKAVVVDVILNGKVLVWIRQELLVINAFVVGIFGSNFDKKRR
jgi:hypothetical protein